MMNAITWIKQFASIRSDVIFCLRGPLICGLYIDMHTIRLELTNAVPTSSLYARHAFNAFTYFTHFTVFTYC